jgi:hypothetical protein
MTTVKTKLCSGCKVPTGKANYCSPCAAIRRREQIAAPGRRCGICKRNRKEGAVFNTTHGYCNVCYREYKRLYRARKKEAR